MTVSPFAGVATGVGSWPGTDVREAAASVVGELPLLPHLAELPKRGLGADMIGRAGALLVDIELDAATSGYRISTRPSRTGRLAADFLAEDLDVLEEVWETAGLRGSGLLKVQVAGPFTIAAEIELGNGHRALTDRGALRDIAASIAEGVAVHADEVARRLGADVLVQFDEPRLAEVLAGTVRDVTSLDSARAVPAPDVVSILDEAVARIGRPVAVHSCARDVPFEVFGRSTLSAVSFDLSLLTPDRYDAVGEILQAGGTLVAGVVPTTEPARVPTWREAVTPVVELIDRLGFERSVLRDQISVSPVCGLSGASLSWARTALALVGDVQRALGDDPDSL
ncbi:methionine synthase [Rhodococcoides trifolii]|uniref:Methionine synthase n=1 Tax=Rhodococcoides trifolii TaxID=908250 RepID=A0A917D1K5_9NOCA|nr:methionine synthase [Rhodococcus trifolii]GGG06211.1 methionine synthase [Rhodococcus trifolii]